jgi:nickel/cobalt transporter (NiCoT) family protein
MATNATPTTSTTDEPTVTDKQRIRFTRDEIPRLAGLFGFVALLHIVGFGMFYFYNSQARYHDLSDGKGTLIFAGAGALAYGFGLRHAFDADHISAIDDTTRYLLQKGKRPLGVGFFFSLGHSTIVLALSVGIAVAASAASGFKDSFQAAGGIIGTSVSAVFLYLIASLNLVVLIGIIKMWRAAKRGEYRTEELDQLLASRGLMNRIFKGRYNKFINHSWQLYPVGVLFGLGFDTATEVGPARPVRHRRSRRRPARTGDHLAAHPVRRRHVTDGHPRRSVHVQGLRLGLRHPHPQDLLRVATRYV